MIVDLLVIGALTISAVEQSQAEDSLSSSIEIQRALLEKSAVSQARIEQVHGKTQELLAKYSKVTKELDSLKGYDDHLEQMVQEQTQAIDELEQQLTEIGTSQRDVVPLMLRMVEALSRFIELDVPFHLVERRQHVAELAAMLNSPDVSVAEKYRRILEAYRIEVEYGRSVEAYRGTLTTSVGEQTVEFLRLGRLSLIYQTLDRSESKIWDQKKRTWMLLPDDFQLVLNKAFRVARKQAAPELLKLPVFIPESM